MQGSKEEISVKISSTKVKFPIETLLGVNKV